MKLNEYMTSDYPDELWSLDDDDIQELLYEAIDRIRAAEAENARLRELHDDRVQDLQHEYARAEAAEAECERLREQVAAGGWTIRTN